MRPDYCPIGGEPCQSVCAEPCSVVKKDKTKREHAAAPQPVYTMGTPQSIGLRDWFAGLAMQGICTSQMGLDWTNQTIAKEAYLLADAMLKARGEK